MKKYWLYILMLCAGSAYTQDAIFNVKLSKDTVTIGASVNIIVQLNQLPQKGSLLMDFNRIENLVYDQDTAALEEIGDFDVTNAGSWSKYLSNDKILIPVEDLRTTPLPIEAQLSISAFSIGVFNINPPSVLFDKDTMPSTFSSLLFVNPPEGFMQDSTQIIKDIKPIIAIETTWKDYLPYLYSILGLLVLSLLAWYLYKKWMDRTLPIEEEYVDPEPVEVIPAHVKALLELDRLQAEKIWDQGLIKEYQTQLTSIIRTYIQDRYGVNAPEMTTGELMVGLRSIQLGDYYEQELRQILTIADLVKFAKATPDSKIHQEFLDKAFQFVHHTKEAATDE